MKHYLEPTQEAGRAQLQRAMTGPVVMLNLLRFRKVAEAYERYVAHILPYLKESGGELLLLGEGGPYLIVPEKNIGIVSC